MRTNGIARIGREATRGLRRVRCMVGLLGMVLSACLAVGDSVLWSDGRTWDGTVRMGGDGRLPLHDGKRIRPIALDDIARIEWQVETQRMERAWNFVEAGRTEKRFEGEPYPVRHWRATVTLRTGEAVPGHLISTVFFLEDEEGTSRLVVTSKQRGLPGQRPGELVAPVELRLAGWSGEGGENLPATVRRLRIGGEAAGLSVAVATLDPTLALDVREEASGQYRFALEGKRPILALRRGNTVRVGWPDAPDQADVATLRERVQAALPEVRDFFDERRIVGVLRDPADPGRGHSLMLLLREGKTTLGGAKPNPWHVEVWTWRLGEDGRLLFEGRALLARDRRSGKDPEPEVVVDPALDFSGAWAERSEVVLDGFGEP